jgi:hypothetical protein
MSNTELQLTNDDEPTRLAPLRVEVRRTVLAVEGQQAVLASVDPLLTGNGWGNGTSIVLLVSHTRGVRIDHLGPAGGEPSSECVG